MCIINRSQYVAAILITVTCGRLALAQQLKVDANVHVSTENRTMPHMEVVACGNRRTPSALLVGSMASRHGQYATFLYRSEDRGKTWKQVLQTVDFGSFGDPTCAFGADGRAYYGVLWSRRSSPEVPGVPSLNMWVYASPDRGQTWGKPVKQPGIDRPFLVADPLPSRARYVYYSALGVSESLSGRDRTRVAADDPNVETGLELYVSSDGGKSFQLQATPRYGRRGDWLYGTGNSVVTSSGAVVSLFRVLKDRLSRPYAERSEGESTLSIVRTSAGGASMTPVVPLGIVRGGGFPALTVDSTGGRFHDRLYAVARDGSSIVLFWSGDEGRTWHGATKVRDAPATNAPVSVPVVFNPAAAVNPDGVLGVAWAEGSRDKQSPLYPSWTYRMAASWDGGKTFSEAVAVSSDRHDPARSTIVSLRTMTRRDEQGDQIGTLSVDPFPDTGGHTFGLVADESGAFHAFWTDNRTGIPQVWTATVHAAGAAAPGGEGLQAAAAIERPVEDITAHVAVELGDTILMPESRRISVTAHIRNTSPGTVLGPVRLHISNLQSPFSVMSPSTRPPVSQSAGTVLDFNDAVSPRGLALGEASGEKTLAFELGSDTDFDRIKGTAAAVLTMSFRVYGRYRPAP